MALLVLVAIAAAEEAPRVIVAVSLTDPPAGECTLTTDGEFWGPIPIVGPVPSGTRVFLVACADGRTESWTRLVHPGGPTRIELGPLTEPAPGIVRASVETYLFLSTPRGETVRIDGGGPVALPVTLRLTAGPHTFVVSNPDGTMRSTATRSVVEADGRAVVRLD